VSKRCAVFLLSQEAYSFAGRATYGNGSAVQSDSPSRGCAGRPASRNTLLARPPRPPNLERWELPGPAVHLDQQGVTFDLLQELDLSREVHILTVHH